MTEDWDPWPWLLGQTEEGHWRMQVPGFAKTSRSPESNPKFMLFRRTTPFNDALMARVLEPLTTAGPGAEGVRWFTHKSSKKHERRNWIFFHRDAARKGTEQYLFGLEFLAKDRMALWFFSGFHEPNLLSDGYLEAYEGHDERLLPRFELNADSEFPLTSWMPQMLDGELKFAWGFESESKLPPTELCDRSQLVTDSLIQTDLSWGHTQARIILSERKRSQLIELKKLRNDVGRHEDCDVVSQHLSVSARHALIELRDQDAQLMDLGSQNGSWLHGRPLVAKQPCLLPDTAALRFGQCEAYFTRLREDQDVSEDSYERLVESGRLSETSLDDCRRLAEEQGISVGEQLILEGLLSPDELARSRGVSYPRPPWVWTSLGVACGVGVVTVVAWWLLLGFA